MIIRNSILIVLLFLISACKSTQDISSYPPYKEAIGHRMTLKRPVMLEESLIGKNGDTLTIYANPDGSMSRYVISYSAKDADRVLPKVANQYNDLYLVELGTVVYTKRYTLEDIKNPSRTALAPEVTYPQAKGFLHSARLVLPVGLPVTLKRVEFRDHDLGQFVMAVVSFDLPETRERISALYRWGDGDWLSRAPWEDNSVPEERHISPNGVGYIQ